MYRLFDAIFEPPTNQPTKYRLIYYGIHSIESKEKHSMNPY